MPRGKKGKELGSKSRATRKSTNRVTRGTGKPSLDDLATVLVPHHDTRSGLRSRTSAGSALSITDDPESILHKARKARKARETAQAQSQLPGIAKSIESPLAEEDRRIYNGASEEYSDEDTPVLQDTDPDQTFYRKWDYLPPLDEEAIAIIDTIIANPDMTRDSKRISAENAKFLQGLRYQNVFLTESSAPDPYGDHVKSLASGDFVLKTDEEKKLHEQL